jgi:hypothetical protein
MERCQAGGPRDRDVQGPVPETPLGSNDVRCGRPRRSYLCPSSQFGSSSSWHGRTAHVQDLSFHPRQYFDGHGAQASWGLATCPITQPTIFLLLPLARTERQSLTRLRLTLTSHADLQAKKSPAGVSDAGELEATFGTRNLRTPGHSGLPNPGAGPQGNRCSWQRSIAAATRLSADVPSGARERGFLRS